MKTRDTLRTQIRKKRHSITSEEQQQAAFQLAQKLTQHSLVTKSKNIAIFLSNDGEIGTLPFINWCWLNNKAIYLPVVHPFTQGHLLFLEYLQKSEMTINQYGIYEPTLNIQNIISPHQLDIIFTPLVAFDSNGNRLGMGGGYYDRLLAPWFKNKMGGKPIGLAHDCQQVQNIPHETWDIPLPEIITPSKHFYITDGT
ncbi:MAG: 5-formyltetrahydrofolate cyclo-ligase [Psychromonas sp.]|nr:5-formyltetrahydrofolate cyclo-ligase [Psychromonas sp.]